MSVAEARKLHVVPDEEGPRIYCLDCRDEPSAWRSFWCAGVGKYRATTREKVSQYVPSSQCGRRQDHYAHTYVERCGCSDTNPVIGEHRRRMAEFRTKKAEQK